MNLSQKPNRIWVRDTLAFGSGIRSHFRSGPKSHLGQEPKVEGTNRIWVRNQIALGPKTKLHSGQGPNRICAGDLFAFRSVTKTFLGICIYTNFSKFFKTGAYEFFQIFSKLVPTNFFNFFPKLVPTNVFHFFKTCAYEFFAPGSGNQLGRGLGPCCILHKGHKITKADELLHSLCPPWFFLVLTPLSPNYWDIPFI